MFDSIFHEYGKKSQAAIKDAAAKTPHSTLISRSAEDIVSDLIDAYGLKLMHFSTEYPEDPEKAIGHHELVLKWGLRRNSFVDFLSQQDSLSEPPTDLNSDNFGGSHRYIGLRVYSSGSDCGITGFCQPTPSDIDRVKKLMIGFVDDANKFASTVNEVIRRDTLQQICASQGREKKQQAEHDAPIAELKDAGINVKSL